MNGLLLFVASLLVTAEPPEPATLVVVVGAPGTPEYGAAFQQWAGRWSSAAAQAGARCLCVGPVEAEKSDRSDPSDRSDRSDPSDPSDKDRLKDYLAAECQPSLAPLWLVLIGHGTFDGEAAKFNLRGPDLSDRELAEWLRACSRPLVVINCSSSSAPFINRLSHSGRVVIAATKSGYELNYARFGDYLSAAIADRRADLDKDGQTSLLEAFLLASARVGEFYDQDARLRTETALLDDNGDGRGTPATFFRGIHATRKPKDGAGLLDGARAHQFHLLPHTAERELPAEVRARRDALELQLAQLRQTKGEVQDEDAYYAALEPLLVELARLYAEPGPATTSADK